MKRSLLSFVLVISFVICGRLAQPLPAVATGTSPSTTTLDLATTFQTSGQSMWGPGAATDISRDVNIVNLSWNPPEPLSIQPAQLLGASFGPQLTAASHGAIALTAHFHVNLGAVSISYPVRVHLTSPAAKSFRPGDTVTISSQWDKPDPNGWTCSADHGTSTCTNTNGASISIVTPQATFGLVGNFDFHVAATGSICFIVCTDPTSLFRLVGLPFDQIDAGPYGPVDIPLPFPAADGNVAFMTNPTIGVDRFNIPDNNDFGISGSVGGPLAKLDAAAGAGDGSVTAGGTVAPIDLNLDVISMLRAALDPLPVPPLAVDGSFSVAGHQGSFHAALLSVVEQLLLESTRNFTFSPNPQVSLQLPAGVNVAYAINDPAGNVIGSGEGNLLTFGADQSISFAFPRAMTSPLALAPTVTLNNLFSNTSATRLSLTPQDTSMLSIGLSFSDSNACVGFVCVPLPTFSAGPLLQNFVPAFSTNFDGIFDTNRTFSLDGFGSFSPVNDRGLPIVIVLDPKHPLTVTTSSATRLYGDPNPAFSGAISGFDPGDENSISATFGTAADPTSSVGNYPITIASINDPLGKMGNYYLVTNYGNLTVTPAPLQVVAADANRLYGGANPAFSGAITGIRNGDPISASYDAPGVNAASDVGTYPIVSTLIDPAGRLGNYAVSSSNGTLTVNPAPLTVTADNQSRPYGTPNPSLTATVSGFVNGETLTTSDVRGSAACTTSASQTSGVAGSPYSITCASGTLTSRHYTLASFQPGSLQIVPAPTQTILTTAPNPSLEGQPVSLRAQVASVAPQGLNPTNSGNVTFSDGATAMGSSVVDSTSAGLLTISTLTAGHHQLSVAYSGDSNYLPSQSSTITQGVRNNRIAVMSTRDGAAEIYLIKGNGSSPTRLTHDNGLDTQPALSPDGTRVVYVGVKSGGANLFIIQADGSGARQLTSGAAVDNSPSWSPDGTRIVFSTNRDGPLHLYTIAADGSAPMVRLTSDTANDTTPAWSPNGRAIAFTRAGTTGVQLYTIAPDGSGLSRLTNSLAIDTTPAWSPDGNRIAFTSTRQGLPAVYLMNADGTNVVRLTNDGAADATPSWAPDGSRLAFTTTLSGSVQVYTINPDGSGRTQITAAPGINALPSWTTPLVP